MRILALAQNLPSENEPDRGRFIARHLAVLRRNHEVTAIRIIPRLSLRPKVLEKPPVASEDVWEVHIAGPPAVREWLADRRLKDIARRHDVIHTHALESARFGWALGASTGVPWLHTEHATQWPDPTGRRIQAANNGLAKRAVREATASTAVSMYLARAMERSGVSDVFIVPNVIDAAGFPLRQAPQHGSGPIRIVSTGSFTPAKDPLLAASAVAMASSSLDGAIEWTWIGRGPLQSAFEAKVDALGLRPLTRVIPPMEPEEYVGELRSHDVFFLPSRFETFCVAAAEALAVGLPVIVGPRGGQVEFVTESVGRVASSHTAGAYAESLASVIERLSTFTPAALRLPLERFSPAAVGRDFDAALDFTMGKSMPTPLG